MVEIIDGDEITCLYGLFLEHLREQEEKISVLQLSGKIEDFLVKEFAYYVSKKTKGKDFVLTNYGKKDDHRKIDICLIRRKSPWSETNDKIEEKDLKIYGMIEVKYIRNKHRFYDGNAKDEITSILKNFKGQLGVCEKPSHGRINVNLPSKDKNIYGLVFASYVSRKKNEEEKKEFYQLVQKQASGFINHDLNEPDFDNIFDNVEVKVLETTYYTTLKAGLWIKLA